MGPAPRVVKVQLCLPAEEEGKRSCLRGHKRLRVGDGGSEIWRVPAEWPGRWLRPTLAARRSLRYTTRDVMYPSADNAMMTATEMKTDVPIFTLVFFVRDNMQNNRSSFLCWSQIKISSVTCFAKAMD